MKRTIFWVVVLFLSLAACGSEATSPVTTPDASVTYEPSPINLLDDASPFSPLEDPDPVPVKPCSARDQAAALAVARRLRKVDYPYHLQAVAVSPPFASGCRALIIAEPPPHFSQQQLQAISPRLLATAAINEHRVGFDGWVKDLVVTLPRVAGQELDDLISTLHLEMFGTTDGAQAIDTSVRPPRHDPATAPLDLAIGPGDLHRWLIDANRTFIPRHGEDKITFRDLLTSSEPGVYLDSADELVTWVVPRDADINDLAREFRQFAVASDLIVGAIASSSTVAIVARRRLADMRIMPPLRFETVSLLAAVGKGELGQSFERMHLLAGRIERGRDWAPIYLSPELHDTEYGSLLNITDQFLKSWSNLETTRYVNFMYPAPRIPWPFSQPVYKEARSGKLTYNWNADNSGGVVRVGNDEIFWMRRTGALNVSYFPEGSEAHLGAEVSLLPLEEKACEFFALTQTPMLVRVAQYNSIFQIFSRYGLTSSVSIQDIDRSDANGYLEKSVNALLRGIRSGYGSISRSLVSAGIPLAASAVAAAGRELEALDEVSLGELAKLLSAPREVVKYSAKIDPAFRALLDLVGKVPLAEQGVAKDYASRVVPREGSWIHTPAIVISWNTGQDGVFTIGGHSLSAKVATLRVHPSAISPGMAQRAAGKAVDTVSLDELDRLMLGPRGVMLADAPVQRQAQQALGIPQVWPPKPSALPEREAPSGAMRVTRTEDGYRLVTEKGAKYEATTMPEVIDLLAARRGVKGEPLRLELTGFTRDEARGMLRSAEVRSRARHSGVLQGDMALATQRIDFDQVRVYKAQSRLFEDGAGEIAMAVEVLSKIRPPLGIRIKLAFRKISSERLRILMAKAQEIVDSVVARFAKKPTTPNEFGTELHRQLKETLIRSGDFCEIKISQEAADFTIVLRDVEQGHGANRRAG